jgi:ABC-type transport system involved in multi-copper enzyme maturation permease subunit
MIINIFIFVFIGAFIILICDYITELAIQIGSTKTSNVLEPYIKYNIYMQHHFQHLQNMQNMQMPNMPMPNMPMQNMPMQNMPMQNMPMQNMPMQNMQIPNMPMSQNQGFPYNIPDMPSPIGIAK